MHHIVTAEQVHTVRISKIFVDFRHQGTDQPAVAMAFFGHNGAKLHQLPSLAADQHIRAVCGNIRDDPSVFHHGVRDIVVRPIAVLQPAFKIQAEGFFGQCIKTAAQGFVFADIFYNLHKVPSYSPPFTGGTAFR